MEIKDKKLKDIFTTNAGADKFTIPDYQRPYVWDEDKVEEYFNDLVNDNEVNLPFLGSFIFQNQNNEYDIVDGQQRFITTTILIAVLRNISDEKRSEDGLTEHIKRQLDNFHHQTKSRLVDVNNLGDVIGLILTVWEKERDFFEKYILKGEEEKLQRTGHRIIKKDKTKYNIYKNYWKLFDMVEETIAESGGNVTSVLNHIMSKLDEMKVVTIEVDTDVEAYTAFEIVNARGQELGNIDLLKNLFYKSASAVEDIDWMKETWEKMISNIEDCSGSKVNTESFLKLFWHSYFGGSRFATTRTMFSRFKQYMQEKTYKEVAQKLLYNSELFKTFFDLIEYDWTNLSKYNKRILVSLKFLRSFNITQAYILFLSIIRNKLDDKKISQIVEATEKFHFAYSAVSKKQANKMEKLYGKFAEAFEKVDKEDSNTIGTLYSQFINKLEDLLPGEGEFLENFIEINYIKKKEVIRYIFYKIHQENCDGATILDFDSGRANLEHINSQEQSNNEVVLNSELLHNIGNIMPLSARDNNRARNATLRDKIEQYKNSGETIPIVEEAINRIEANNFRWDKNDIEKWREHIGKKIFNIIKKLS